MYVQCPNANHLIDLPDDFAGAQAYCPHCRCLIPFQTAPVESPAERIQASPPSFSVAPAPSAQEAKNLEEQIYDGLPPLAVMMALRRRRGKSYDDEDLARKYPMTDDDWKALAAYEAALWAAVSLRTAFGVGGVALAANLPIMAASAMNLGVSPEARDAIFRVASGLLVVLLGCFLVQILGNLALQKVRTHGIVDCLTGANCCVFAIFAGAVAFSIHRLYVSSDLGFFSVASIPFSLAAVFTLGRTTWQVSRALHQLEPPEITNRLQEALKYLE